MRNCRRIKNKFILKITVTETYKRNDAGNNDDDNGYGNAHKLIIDDDISELANEELNDLYYNKDSKRISDNYITFFERLHTEKTVNILTCSLQRVSNNQKKGTTMEQPDRMNNNCYNIGCNTKQGTLFFCDRESFYLEALNDK